MSIVWVIGAGITTLRMSLAIRTKSRYAWLYGQCATIRDDGAQHAPGSDAPAETGRSRSMTAWTSTKDRTPILVPNSPRRASLATFEANE